MQVTLDKPDRFFGVVHRTKVIIFSYPDSSSNPILFSFRLALGGATNRGLETLITLKDDVSADISDLPDCDSEANPLLVKCSQVVVNEKLLTAETAETITVMQKEVMKRTGLFGSTVFYEVNKTLLLQA